jgi:hypothetical protein
MQTCMFLFDTMNASLILMLFAVMGDGPENQRTFIH